MELCPRRTRGNNCPSKGKQDTDAHAPENFGEEIGGKVVDARSPFQGYAVVVLCVFVYARVARPTVPVLGAS